MQLGLWRCGATELRGFYDWRTACDGVTDRAAGDGWFPGGSWRKKSTGETRVDFRFAKVVGWRDARLRATARLDCDRLSCSVTNARRRRLAEKGKAAMTVAC